MPRSSTAHARPFFRRLLPALAATAALTGASSFAVGQQLSWVKDIGGTKGEVMSLAGVAVVDEGGQSRTIVVGNTYGRLPGAVPAIPNQVLGTYDPSKREIFVRKLDAAGNTLWTVQYPMSPPGSTSFGAVAMAAGPTAIYVTGGVTSGSTYQIFVASFALDDGELLWIAQFSADVYIAVADLALDASGVTVCGEVHGDLSLDPDLKHSTPGTRDAFVSRWSLAGTHIATDQFGAATFPSFSALAKAVAAGPDGTIHVASYWPVYEGGRWWTIGELRRYDPSPAGLTFRDSRLLDLGGFQTLPIDLEVGPSGILGLAAAVASWEPNHVFAISPADLSIRWNRTIAGMQPQGLALSGDTLLVGGGDFIGSQGTGSQGALAVLDAVSGASIDAPLMLPKSSGFYPVRLAPGASDVIFGGELDVAYDGTLSTSSPTNGRDLAVGRVSGGVHTLVHQIHADVPARITLGSVGCDGSSYVAFSSSGLHEGATPIGGSDVYLRRYLPDGSSPWTRVLGTSSGEQAEALCMDETSIYVAGRTNGVFPGEIAVGVGHLAIFVCRFDLDGNLIWIRTFRHESNSPHPNDLTVAGNVLLLCGDTNLSLPWVTKSAPDGIDEAFAIRLDAGTGQPVWTTAIAPLAGRIFAEGVTSDVDGVYLAGRGDSGAYWPGQPALGNIDAILLKLDLATGQTLQWARVIGSANPDGGNDVVRGNDGIYIGGSHGASPYDGFVQRYGPNGDLTGDWRITGHGPVNGTDLVRALAADASGVYCAGRTAGLDGQVYAGGIGDAFVAKLGATPGTIAWVRQFGTAGFDEVIGLSVCESCLCAVGTTGGSFDNPNILSPFGRDYGFVARISLDQPPVADAGADQPAHCGLPVMLDGRGSYDDNTPGSELLFQWSFVSTPAGSGAVLLAADQPQAGFVPFVEGEYVVLLTVYDSLGQSSSDTLTVSSSNLAPAAEARATSPIHVSQTSTLDGSGSTDPDSDPLTYQWSIVSAPAGSSPVLEDPTLAIARFRPDMTGEYVLGLVVTDLCTSSPLATVNVLVISRNDFVVQKLLAAQAAADGLAPAQWAHDKLATPFVQHLVNAIAKVEAEQPANARQQILLAMTRTDGFPLRNALDGNGPDMDWIIDPDAQREIYAFLLEALGALGP